MSVSNEPFSLSPWYLHNQRLLGLFNQEVFDARLERARRIGDLAGYRHAPGIYNHVMTTCLVEWLRNTKAPSLGEMILRATLRPGALFTHYGLFHFKGLGHHGPAVEPFKARSGRPLPTARSKLDPLAPGCQLSVTYSPEHLLSVSSWEFMSGNKTMLFLGAVDSQTPLEIRAVPFAFGTMLTDYTSGTPSIFALRWNSSLEVTIDEIDSFDRVRGTPHVGREEINALRDIPEEHVKTAFAEIIGEAFVVKDWGGEQSDLFSNRVILDGRRVNTAFAFKGPAKFQPMTPAILGKNGDQLFRLFAEPAELFVLQHCHQITTAVRAQMRAFATRPGEPKLFCLIDGADTLRLLRAYKKCGF